MAASRTRKAGKKDKMSEGDGDESGLRGECSSWLRLVAGKLYLILSFFVRVNNDTHGHAWL